VGAGGGEEVPLGGGEGVAELVPGGVDVPVGCQVIVSEGKISRVSELSGGDGVAVGMKTGLVDDSAGISVWVRVW